MIWCSGQILQLGTWHLVGGLAHCLPLTHTLLVVLCALVVLCTLVVPCTLSTSVVLLLALETLVWGILAVQALSDNLSFLPVVGVTDLGPEDILTWDQREVDMQI